MSGPRNYSGTPLRQEFGMYVAENACKHHWVWDGPALKT